MPDLSNIVCDDEILDDIDFVKYSQTDICAGMTKSALKSHGIKTIKELASFSDHDLLQIGISGKGTMKTIRAILLSRNLRLKGE